MVSRTCHALTLTVILPWIASCSQMPTASRDCPPQMQKAAATDPGSSAMLDVALKRIADLQKENAVLREGQVSVDEDLLRQQVSELQSKLAAVSIGADSTLTTPSAERSPSNGADKSSPRRIVAPVKVGVPPAKTSSNTLSTSKKPPEKTRDAVRARPTPSPTGEPQPILRDFKGARRTGG